LLYAIRASGTDIKINTIEVYSEQKERYFYKYMAYIKKRDKYRLDNEMFSKIDLLKYLIDKYKEVRKWEKKN
jgi:hypothetical protein